jgi:hypothetical protein
VRRRVLPLLALLALLAGCGGEDGARGAAATTATSAIALGRAPAAEGEVVVRGEASPQTHGPFVLHGRYRARFEQAAPEDPGLDFTQQTPFVARLDPHATSDADRSTRLFRTAARTGERTITADGKLFLDVEFGDFPYVIRLTPQR